MLEIRTFENRPGQVYDPTDLTRLFAEDINSIVEYINTLPTEPSPWSEVSSQLYPTNYPPVFIGNGALALDNFDCPFFVYNPSDVVGQIAQFDGVGQDGAGHDIYITFGAAVGDAGSYIAYSKDNNVFRVGIHGHATGFATGIDGSANVIVMIGTTTDDTTGAILQNVGAYCSNGSLGLTSDVVIGSDTLHFVGGLYVGIN